MRVLLIKTSSMGDLIHTLPALTDALLHYPDLKIDWVVEESFVDIPSWHPAVNRVIPIALRRLRKNLTSLQTWKEWVAMRRRLREEKYDIVLDAQGLVKSALLTFMARGKRIGLDRQSAREGLAAFAYQTHCTVNFQQHAIHRMRSLFSQAFNYPLPTTPPDFGLKGLLKPVQEPYLVFLHGTTWSSKQWPEEYWLALATKAAASGFRIKISGASEAEVARAARLAASQPAFDPMPRLRINAMADLLAGSAGAIAVDTGFAHLAAALGLPTVSIFGSTNPEFTGAVGDRAVNLGAQFPCSPCLARTCQFKEAAPVTPACYATVNPDRVWQTFQLLTNG